jgi:hypothetical protein
MKIIQNALLPTVKNKTVLRVIDFSKKKRVARVLHLGAGRQSSTIAEMSANGDLPPLDFAIFADTKDEPKWVYEQVEYLKTRLPVVVVEKSAGGIVNDTKYGYGRFASMPFYTKDEYGNIGRLKRQCTHEYKIEVIEGYLRDWLIERGHGKVAKDGSRRISNKVYIESWFGISWDEIQRLNDRSSPWQRDIYPLIDRRMTTQMCLDYLISHGHPVPGKSSCKICAFHDDDYWLDLKVNHPAEFEEACDFDDWIRSPEAADRLSLINESVYLHRSCTPLREVDFAAQSPTPPMFCGAHCMT